MVRAQKLKTHEIEVECDLLTNAAWARLSDLINDELSKSEPEGNCISEAEVMLQLMRAVSEKCDAVILRLVGK